MVSLPYLAAPGSIKTALERIQNAATPERVTQDFIQTKLQIKGGTGAGIPPFLKKIGLVNSDGTPSSLYGKFRNVQTSQNAIAQAIRIGYRELFEVNEYCYELSDKALLPLICQVTGAAATSSVAKLTVASFRNLNNLADFNQETRSSDISTEPSPPQLSNATAPFPAEGRLGLNLSYTINLNLPASSDQAVFNAIFKSLKEHILNDK